MNALIILAITLLGLIVCASAALTIFLAVIVYRSTQEEKSRFTDPAAGMFQYSEKSVFEFPERVEIVIARRDQRLWEVDPGQDTYNDLRN